MYSSFKWRDLPTRLIRAVGEIIGYSPWERAFTREVQKVENVTDDNVLIFLRACAEKVKQECRHFPPDLISGIPAELTAEKIAEVLVRLALVEENDRRPDGSKIGPRHFAVSTVCRFKLLYSLDRFLASLADEEPFYTHLGRPLWEEIQQGSVEKKIRELFVQYADAEFDRIVREMKSRGEELNGDNFGKVIREALSGARRIIQTQLAGRKENLN